MSAQSTWRDHCRPIIAKVISEVGAEDMKVLRAALRAAYPYKYRRMWPYKVWCDEIRVQLGTKKTKPTIEDSPGQIHLFE